MSKKYIAIKPTKKIANDIIKSWPLQSQIQVKDLLKRYGAPDEVTPSVLIWYNRGPWLRTTVYKEQVIHNWPAKHSDILEQYISYNVPINKYDDLAKYDGSVWAERTKGILAARCHLVPMNFVALNIAHELIHDRLTVNKQELNMLYYLKP